MYRWIDGIHLPLSPFLVKRNGLIDGGYDWRSQHSTHTLPSTHCCTTETEYPQQCCDLKFYILSFNLCEYFYERRAGRRNSGSSV